MEYLKVVKESEKLVGHTGTVSDWMQDHVEKPVRQAAETRQVTAAGAVWSWPLETLSMIVCPTWPKPDHDTDDTSKGGLSVSNKDLFFPAIPVVTIYCGLLFFTNGH